MFVLYKAISSPRSLVRLKNKWYHSGLTIAISNKYWPTSKLNDIRRLKSPYSFRKVWNVGSPQPLHGRLRRRLMKGSRELDVGGKNPGFMDMTRTKKEEYTSWGWGSIKGLWGVSVIYGGWGDFFAKDRSLRFVFRILNEAPGGRLSGPALETLLTHIH